VSAEAGHLNHFRAARTGTRAQIDHALTVQVTIDPFLVPEVDDQALKDRAR
jgi:hypothetical protein